MKKPSPLLLRKPILLFSLFSLLFAFSVTLFAQTTTGTSLITEMKAAVRNFTLASDLNPGITSLQSSPVTGKQTGDMLTAGEYNRILELVGQGGGGGGGSGWEDVPLTDTADFDTSCEYKFKLNVPAQYGLPTGEYWFQINGVGAKSIIYTSHSSYVSHINSNSKNAYRVNGGSLVYTVLEIKKRCGGGGGGGSGWEDVPLTGTADFDVSCIYRVIASGSVMGNSILTRYSVGVQLDTIFFGFNLNPGWIGGFVNKATKGTFGTNSNGTFTVTTLQKNCGGGGGSSTGGGTGGGGSGLDCTQVTNNAGTTPAIATCPADRTVVSGGCSGFVPAANPIARMATNDFYCSNTSVQQGGIAYATCCKLK